MKKSISFLVIILTLISGLSFSSQLTLASTKRVKLTQKLLGLNNVVVQTISTNQHHKYALQRIFEHSIIYRSIKTKKKHTNFTYRSQLYLMNFGHTQTLVHMGHDNWLVGCTPRNNGRFPWSTEFAVVTYPKNHSIKKVIHGAHKLPRLTNLKAATDLPEKSRKTIRRAEAALSPNRKYFLIATIDVNNTGHFALYHFSTIKRKLTKAQHHKKKTVNLGEISPLSAFHISNFYGNKSGQVHSVQGYVIDNKKHIYISAENCNRNSIPREIIKFNWGCKNFSNFKHYCIKHSNWSDRYTELEGMEIKGSAIDITVAFHSKKNNIVTKNQIYRINNIVG